MSTIELAEPTVEEEREVRGPGQLRQIGRRLRSNVPAMIGLILVALIGLTALFAPWIARYDPNAIGVALNQNPSLEHWLGTDYLGRDISARLVYGGRISLMAGFAAVAISFSIGTPIGIIAGYGHRAIDDILMRVIDMLLAVPGILLAISIVTILGVGLKSVVIAVGVAGIAGYARVARGSTLEIKAHDYVLASEAQGASSRHIMQRHVLPNIVAPLVVLSTLDLSGAILATAALSYLGLGTQPPTADWGTMLAQGYENMFLSSAQVVFPGLVIFATVLAVNFIGDGLGEALNPKL